MQCTDPERAANMSPGTIMHVFSRDWAAMTDEDVVVGWDVGRPTRERLVDLDGIPNSGR